MSEEGLGKPRDKIIQLVFTAVLVVLLGAAAALVYNSRHPQAATVIAAPPK